VVVRAKHLRRHQPAGDLLDHPGAALAALEAAGTNVVVADDRFVATWTNRAARRSADSLGVDLGQLLASVPAAELRELPTVVRAVADDFVAMVHVDRVTGEGGAPLGYVVAWDDAPAAPPSPSPDPGRGLDVDSVAHLVDTIGQELRRMALDAAVEGARAGDRCACGELFEVFAAELEDVAAQAADAVARLRRGARVPDPGSYVSELSAAMQRIANARSR
jgi:hypothetical protein